MIKFPWKSSSDYKIITHPNIKILSKKYSSVWQGESLPEMQNKFTKHILKEYRNIAAIEALIGLTKRVTKKGDSVLEIGCSTGYHGKIFQLEKMGLKYEGCDYSPSFIKRAKELYPDLPFKTADNTKLSYRSKSFDLVISGCCLLHIVNYHKAITETARTAKKSVIFHRTPIVNSAKTTFVTKHAYGTEMLEIIFNEQELVNRFSSSKLAIIGVTTCGSYKVYGLSEQVLIKDYLCLKI